MTGRSAHDSLIVLTKKETKKHQRTMTDKEFEERFEETWAQITTDAPLIASNELKSALDLVGYKLPHHQVRELLNDLKNRGKLDSNEGISKEVFKEVTHYSFISFFSATPFPSRCYRYVKLSARMNVRPLSKLPMSSLMNWPSLILVSWCPLLLAAP